MIDLNHVTWSLITIHLKVPKSTEIKIFFKVKYFYHNYSLFSNDLSNNQIEKIITKTSVQLFLRIGFFHKCIHLSYNHEIENLDFNLRQRMGAGIYFQTEHESKTWYRLKSLFLLLYAILELICKQWHFIVIFVFYTKPQFMQFQTQKMS